MFPPSKRIWRRGYLSFLSSIRFTVVLKASSALQFCWEEVFKKHVVYIFFLQENLGGTGSISTAEAEEYLREHMKLEGELERQRQENKEMQIAAVKEKLEQRKKERLRKLKEKQELERAQVRLLYLSLYAC